MKSGKAPAGCNLPGRWFGQFFGVVLACVPAAALGQVRMFMAPDGQQGSVPPMGPSIVTLDPGQSLTVMVWLQDGAAAQQLHSYQVGLPAGANPQPGSSGSVMYVDPPATPGGGSVQINAGRPDWVFAGQPAVPMTNEGPGFFTMAAQLPPGAGVNVAGLGIAYLGQFAIQASPDACGVFMLQYLPPPQTGFTDPMSNLYFVQQLQPLQVIVGDPDCGGGPCVCQRCIPAGSDCWSTPCGETLFDFCDTPIPAGFFDPGSEPFDGIVLLGGSGTGSDTMVQRLDEMCLPTAPPGEVSVEIELVALSLQSCNPITVRIDGLDTLWDVEVDLSRTPTPPGVMNVTKTHPNGGFFSADFFVQPVFIFTPVDDPKQAVTLDTGAAGIPPAMLRPRDTAAWVHEATVPIGPVCGVGFIPGLAEDPLTLEQCCVPVGHAGPGHLHVTGQSCSPCPHGACCLPGSVCQFVEPSGMLTPAQVCSGLGGTYKGDGTDCSDSDGDGLGDWLETQDCCALRDACSTGTDPHNPDSDGDGFDDGVELACGSDACVPDADDNQNGVPDACEAQACCLPEAACADLTASACVQAEGLPQGLDSQCTGVECPLLCPDGVVDCADDDVCTIDQCVVGVCSYEQRAYGDTTSDGQVNLLDILCVLDAFQSRSGAGCTASSADLSPCTGDGVIDLADLLGVLDAFRGHDPCACSN